MTAEASPAARARGAELNLRSCLEWRPLLWQPAAEAGLSRAALVLRPGATILEIGYASGMMSCYLASTYGAKVVGYDVRPAAQAQALHNRERFGLEDAVDFRLCSPEETLELTGQYDLVFMKSVLYHIAVPDEYRRWLRWTRSVIRPGGCFLALENGSGNALTRATRRWVLRSRYVDRCLFDEARAQDFADTFDLVEIRYFGRYSQFVESVPGLGRAVFTAEQRYAPPTSSAHFVAAITAWRN